MLQGPGEGLARGARRADSPRAAGRLPARLRSRQTSRGARRTAFDSRTFFLSRRHARPELRAPPGDHQRHHRTPAGAGRRSESRLRSTSNRRPRPSTCRRSRRENPNPLLPPAVGTAHLAGQHADGADALRPVEQHRLRGRRTTALHVVSARATAESLRRTHRVHHLRAADQHGGAQESRTWRAFRVSPRHSPPRSARSSNPATRCTFPTAGGTTSKSLDAFQRAGKLLVERGAPGRLALRLHAARHPGGARPAPRAARGVAHDVRTLRISVGRTNPWRTCRASSAACWARPRPNASRPSAPSWRAPSPAKWGHLSRERLRHLASRK